jgi:tetratricopeptide (TPR) repeat protein
LFQDGNEREKALEYAPRIVELYQKAGAKKDEAIGYLTLSGSYHTLGQYEEAFGYLNKFWELSEEVKPHNIYHGNALIIAAQCFFSLGKADTAVVLIKRAITESNTDVFEEISLKSEYEWGLGYFYIQVNEMDSASKYLYQSIKTNKTIGNAFNQLIAKRYLAEMYLKQSDFERCNAYCDSALQIANYIDNTGTYYFNDSLKHAIATGEDIHFPISQLRRRYYAWHRSYGIYKLLWESYISTEDFEKATQIREPWEAVLDSIYVYQRNKNVLAINVSYETEKKEEEIIRLDKENQLKELQLRQTSWIIGGLVIIVLMIIAMAVILIRQNKLKNEQHTLVLQQRLFRLQMNPHFLYNSLASIQNFIITKKPSEASSYLSKFSKLVRQILNSSASEYISLEEELNSIENYISLQKIRYRDMFDYRIDKEESIDAETTSIPPMLAQPFIENSIEHGFKNKNSKGFIHINIKKKQDYFILEIEDNGVGRSKTKELEKTKRKDHKSMATTITKDRMDALNKKLKQKIHFKIIDLKDENGKATGTKVVFEIPLSL